MTVVSPMLTVICPPSVQNALKRPHGRAQGFCQMQRGGGHRLGVMIVFRAVQILGDGLCWVGGASFQEKELGNRRTLKLVLFNVPRIAIGETTPDLQRGVGSLGCTVRQVLCELGV